MLLALLQSSKGPELSLLLSILIGLFTEDVGIEPDWTHLELLLGIVK